MQVSSRNNEHQSSILLLTNSSCPMMRSNSCPSESPASAPGATSIDDCHLPPEDCLEVQFVDSCMGTLAEASLAGTFELWEGECANTGEQPIFFNNSTKRFLFFIAPNNVWAVAAGCGMSSGITAYGQLACTPSRTPLPPGHAAPVARLLPHRSPSSAPTTTASPSRASRVPTRQRERRQTARAGKQATRQMDVPEFIHSSPLTFRTQ
jgi:hypothetical protein